MPNIKLKLESEGEDDLDERGELTFDPGVRQRGRRLVSRGRQGRLGVRPQQQQQQQQKKQVS